MTRAAAKRKSTARPLEVTSPEDQTNSEDVKKVDINVTVIGVSARARARLCMYLRG